MLPRAYAAALSALKEQARIAGAMMTDKNPTLKHDLREAQNMMQQYYREVRYISALCSANGVTVADLTDEALFALLPSAFSPAVVERLALHLARTYGAPPSDDEALKVWLDEATDALTLAFAGGASAR